MSRNFLLGWALAASAAALLALGYALGRGGAAPVLEEAAVPAASPSTTGDAASALPADPYTIPDGFRGLPAEWRTQVDGDLDGYAILFDVERRELIVERCHHRGYLDTRSGKPIAEGWDFCSNVLWASLTRLEETRATATDRRGQPVTVALALQRESRPARLQLAFGDHDMQLAPGSKNDLFQAMDRMPHIDAQRRRVLALQIADGMSERRVVEEAARRGDDARRVPVFVLPPEEERKREEARLRQFSGRSSSGLPASPEDLAEEARRLREQGLSDMPSSERIDDEALRRVPAPPQEAEVAEPPPTE